MGVVSDRLGARKGSVQWLPRLKTWVQNTISVLSWLSWLLLDRRHSSSEINRGRAPVLAILSVQDSGEILADVKQILTNSVKNSPYSQDSLAVRCPTANIESVPNVQMIATARVSEDSVKPICSHQTHVPQDNEQLVVGAQLLM